jgi:hypothetical protein
MDSGFTSHVTEEGEDELDSVFGKEEGAGMVNVASDSTEDSCSDDDDEVSMMTVLTACTQVQTNAGRHIVLYNYIDGIMKEMWLLT